MTVILLWLLISVVTFLFMSSMTHRLREKEKYEVALWSYAMEQLGSYDVRNPLVMKIVNSRNNIPFIITDENLSPISTNSISEKVQEHPGRLREKIDQFSKINNPITIKMRTGDGNIYMFYGESSLLQYLTYFPIIQLFAFAAFLLFGLIAFRSTKQGEQNRVWVGLAKETAHQLGTPTSSLLGWIEFLRTQPIDQSVVEEMSKDLGRLLKVVDRFSKIGSETVLSPNSINEIVGESVMYFKSRVPKNVVLNYNGFVKAPMVGSINPALFEWVVENLLKNSLDALQGKGEIDVKLGQDNDKIYIDVKDTGKGIAKANFKRIFEPGFTTKTRGWGLGLSLSKRIVEEYHKGKIAVEESEVGKGTTIRITINRAE